MTIPQAIQPLQRYTLRVRFRLRPGQAEGDRPRKLYIRLRLNGVTLSDYWSGVEVRPDRWDSIARRVKGTDEYARRINAQLSDIETAHHEYLAELHRMYKTGRLPHPPTAYRIRDFFNGKDVFPTVINAVATYIKYLHSYDNTPDARADRTMEKWRLGLNYLTAYCEQSKTHRLTVEQTSIGWAEGFYRYCLKLPVGKATAARFVGYVRAALEHLVQAGEITVNPLANYFPSKGKDKPVQYLEPEHVERLAALTLTDPQPAAARDILLLMCYTGMDAGDLYAYSRDRTRYEVRTADGMMIHIPRGKTHLTAYIPLRAEVGPLLARYPAGLPHLSNQALNIHTRAFQALIEYPHRLTTKTCRKTAGRLFLGDGYTLAEVSGILGHGSLQTTLRNYVTVKADLVQAGMRRVTQQAG